MRSDARWPNYPAVLFRKIKGSSVPLLINLQAPTNGSRWPSMPSQEMVDEFGPARECPIPTQRSDRAQGSS